jgi:hypothetical protein
MVNDFFGDIGGRPCDSFLLELDNTWFEEALNAKVNERLNNKNLKGKLP